MIYVFPKVCMYPEFLHFSIHTNSSQPWLKPPKSPGGVSHHSITREMAHNRCPVNIFLNKWKNETGVGRAVKEHGQWIRVLVELMLESGYKKVSQTDKTASFISPP